MANDPHSHTLVVDDVPGMDQYLGLGVWKSQLDRERALVAAGYSPEDAAENWWKLPDLRTR